MGRIVLDRSLIDTDIYLEKPFSKGQARIDLIFLANFKDTSMWVRGIEIKINRGQLARSQTNLMKRWGYSKGKLYRYLDVLKTKHQIDYQTNNITTVITILNYDKYQIGGEQTVHQIEHQTVHQTVHQTEHIRKNINKVNKVNNNIYTQDFELFWKEFPIKKGKPSAYTAWKKIITTTEAKEIIDGAKKYNDRVIKEGTTKIKRPQGRLNDRRWEDEISTPDINKDKALEERRKKREIEKNRQSQSFTSSLFKDERGV